MRAAGNAQKAVWPAHPMLALLFSALGSAEAFIQKVRASGQEVAAYLGIQFVRVPEGERE